MAGTSWSCCRPRYRNGTFRRCQVESGGRPVFDLYPGLVSRPAKGNNDIAVVQVPDFHQRGLCSVNVEQIRQVVGDIGLSDVLSGHVTLSILRKFIYRYGLIPSPHVTFAESPR